MANTVTSLAAMPGRRLVASLAGVAILVLAAAGCGQDEDSAPLVAPAAAPQPSAQPDAEGEREEDTGTTTDAQTTVTVADHDETAEGTEPRPDAEDPVTTPVEPSVPTVTTGPPAATAPVAFVSPSGNIACALSETGVRCETKENSWTTAADHASECGALIGGDSIRLGLGESPELYCRADTLFGTPEAFVLGYGESVTAGELLCLSTEQGMSCGDGGTGRGFLIARAAYQFR